MITGFLLRNWWMRLGQLREDCRFGSWVDSSTFFSMETINSIPSQIRWFIATWTFNMPFMHVWLEDWRHGTNS